MKQGYWLANYDTGRPWRKATAKEVTDYLWDPATTFLAGAHRYVMIYYPTKN